MREVFSSLRGRRAALVVLGALALGAGSSCQSYEAPPEPVIEGLDQNGVLADPQAPLSVRFTRKVDRSTVKLKVAEFVTDNEYRLGDEPDVTPGTKFTQLFAYPAPPPQAPADGEEGLPKKPDVLEFQDDPEVDRLLLKPAVNFPVGSQLVLLVEPGLRGENGIETVARRRLTFSYGFTCKGNEKPGAFTTGKYIFVVQVNKPIGTQIRLYASIHVDPSNGSFVGQFTNASRRTDQVCPEACTDKKVCRLLPSPGCVVQSERAGSIDEYPDFYPNAGPPVGWTFTAAGCVDAQADGSIRFGARSDRADVAIPKVTIENVTLFGSFKPNDKGELRGIGTFTASQVLIGTTPSGSGQGDVVALRLPDDKVTGIPDPPASAKLPPSPLPLSRKGRAPHSAGEAGPAGLAVLAATR